MKYYVCVESPKYAWSKTTSKRGSSIIKRPTLRRVGSVLHGYGPFDTEDEAHIWAAWRGIHEYTLNAPGALIIEVHK